MGSQRVGHNLATFTSFYKFKRNRMILEILKKKNQYKREWRNGREGERKRGRKVGRQAPLSFIFHTSLEKSISEKVDEHKYFRKQGTQIYKGTLEGKPSKWCQNVTFIYFLVKSIRISIIIPAELTLTRTSLSCDIFLLLKITVLTKMSQNFIVPHILSRTCLLACGKILTFSNVKVW